MVDMPRTARKQSESRIYHVMLRGTNRQTIFHDPEDSRRFLSVLRECKMRSTFHLFAYCLMPNHVHLLIQEGGEPLSTVFRRIGSRYVYWYNLKYDRVGHLFQDRYKSEAVENDAYFLTVLRYILQNPMKAGMEATPGHYPLSSYGAYSGQADGLTDTAFALDLLDGREALLRFLAEVNEDRVLDLDGPNTRYLSDFQAAAIFQQQTGCAGAKEFQALPPRVQRALLLSLSDSGLNKTQLAALTLLPRTTIRRILVKEAAR